jgi:hypothetical protein
METLNWADLSSVESSKLKELLPTLNEHYKMKLYRELENRKKRHSRPPPETTEQLQAKRQAIDHWLGFEFIKYKPTVTPPCESPIYLKGDLSYVEVLDSSTLQYIDHVSRIHTEVSLGPAQFTKPQLSPVSHIFDIPAKEGLQKGPGEELLEVVPEAYSYNKMEDDEFMQKNIPVNIGLPPCFADKEDYIFNETGELSECILHLPVKVSKAKADELNRQGRVTCDGEEFSEKKCYLPIELKSLEPFIRYTMEKEVLYNPYFLEHFYLFVSVSHSYVQPTQMQRRGGWHVDGHQGYERIQEDGIKLPTDRQYTISNTLPTEFVTQTFCFDKLREYLVQECCSMDSVNFQHVLEEHVNREIIKRGRENVVKTAETNSLSFFNPYVVHKAAVNTSDKPVLRTFCRLLYGVYPRDRLGDSINPLFGPIFPLKIKVITDIHEPDVSII